LDIGRQFDPCNLDGWRSIAHRLDGRFLWMPFDYLAHKQMLSELLATAARHPGEAVRFSGTAGSGTDKFEKPAVLRRRDLLDGAPEESHVATVNGTPGISVRPPATVREAEAELVRHSGKMTDGIYSRFNRRLCRPAVRWFSHTPVTPNAVSFVGLAVAVLAGICFAQGSWPWDIAGAALFFISGLFDEIDGMLARLKFQESAFGCWLETMADYSSYLLIFAGMTMGGYRRGGWVYVVMGAALLSGSVLSFVVISIQRKLAAPAGKPNEYARRYLAALDRDAGNPVSRIVRQLQFLTKKGVLIHYLLLFAILGVLPLAMFLSAVGANIAWMVTIYFNRRLFSPGRLLRVDAVSRDERPVEVEK
jgi:phosphatidylglycerophosphate synthase